MSENNISQNNPDLPKNENLFYLTLLEITSVNKLLSYGYKLVDLNNGLRKQKKEQGLGMVLKSKGGGEIVESDLDRAVREVQADILINLSYNVPQGAATAVEFNVTSVDAATAKQISGNVGHSSYGYAPIPDMLNEAVEGFMDNFCTKLDMHFNDMVNNGREGSVIFYIAEDCPFNFDSEFFFNGETGELSELIEYWLRKNTVEGEYILSNESDVRLDFEDVRFPMSMMSKFDAEQEAVDVTKFMRPIAKFLEPLNISCKFQSVGIGQVYILLGSR